jgi:RHS repeat-associated protein
MGTRSRMRNIVTLSVVLGAILVVWPVLDARQQQRAAQAERSGRSATLLPDGRWLLIGGDGPNGVSDAADLFDPASNGRVRVGRMMQPRSGHTATVLADGTVLVVGGRNAAGIVTHAERFDPTTGLFSLQPIYGARARAEHSATLMPDGQLLVVGGSDGGPTPPMPELWSPDRETATPLGAVAVDRLGHTATLLDGGRVRIDGGRTADGREWTTTLIFDAASTTLSTGGDSSPDPGYPHVVSTSPVNDSENVPLDARIVIQFSEPMDMRSLNGERVAVRGRDGPFPVRVVGAEGGRLAFVWPNEPLMEGERYSVVVAGSASLHGQRLPVSSFTFTTVSRRPVADDEEWHPTAEHHRNGWRSNREPSPWETLAPLMAPPGVTAVSGRVLTLDGRPLPGVTLSVEGGGEAESDRTGRFLLLASAATGRQVLEIDGASANRAGRRYGFFEYGLAVEPGTTNVLPFTIWMPKLDTRHTVRIPSPTTSEVVVTTPYIPGLELHIPPNTVIRGEDGKPVTEVGITPIPVDRPPFPLAKNVVVPVYFTVQPGGAYVHTSGYGRKGAWLVYPNNRGFEVGQRLQFYHYEPDGRGWYVYGVGTANRAQVVPDPTTRLYEFTGAMINGADSPPMANPTPDSEEKGDPVDPSTGIFMMRKTDLSIPGVMPLELTRFYNSGDGLARPFGRGMRHAFGMFLWSANQYQEADLFLPGGDKIHFVRTSPGTQFADAAFAHQETPSTSATPTKFYKSTLAWNGHGWDLRLRDGTVYVFGDQAPLQAIRDRDGNEITVSHALDQVGKITQVTSSSGRWIAFTYDASNRIIQAKDNIGRTVVYTYTNGNLATVTDAENNVTTYSYDGSNRLASIKDNANVVYLANVYTNGRVTEQTLAEPAHKYLFGYTVNGAGKVTQTDITDPRGMVERLTFNSDGYVLTDTDALGTPLQRTSTFERQLGSNLVTAYTDGLGRRSEYTYDLQGRILTDTRMAGTADAATTTYTYEPVFGQLATTTDPLGHTWTRTYDAAGRLTSFIDPLTHQTTMTMNTKGQITRVANPLQHEWQFGYANGDLISSTDPLGGVQSRFVDAAGRVLSVTDPLGRVTTAAYDKLNRLRFATDALGAQTEYQYDSTNSVVSVIDVHGHATTFTYDNSSRMATQTDPLLRVTSFVHDQNGNLTSTTDRKSQITNYQYDALNRLAQATYADSSTITYTYDAGDRVTQIVDSANGAITRDYDNFDRITSEMSPQGSVSYTYDDDGRRETMTVAGQAPVSYGWDNDHRLTSITQGSAVVLLDYDAADRRTSLTLPNGVVVSYVHDNMGRIANQTYAAGAATLGDLSYTYDAAGHRTSAGGSWARVGLPLAVPIATYDAAHRVQTWAGTNFNYDLSGNLLNAGLTTYTWDARDQLSAVSGTVNASFQYDGTGRRRGKTVDGVGISFLFDVDNIVQEVHGGTQTVNLLTSTRVDETFGRTDGIDTRWLLADALGSTIALTDSSGAANTQYSFEPFGATVSTGASSVNASQFTGRENDGTGLYYYRARYYDPHAGRFLAEDPLGFAAGLNFYAYALNDPVSLTDPFGLDVNVCLYGGLAYGLGHVGFGLPGEKGSVGFYSKNGEAQGPGEVRADPTTGMQCKKQEAKPEQDNCMKDCRDKRAANPGQYNLTERNCTDFVRDCMAECKVGPSRPFPGPQPRNYYESLPPVTTPKPIPVIR